MFRCLPPPIRVPWLIGVWIGCSLLTFQLVGCKGKPIAAKPNKQEVRAERAVEEKLASLGYINTPQRVASPRAILKHIKGKAYAGLNLLSSARDSSQALLMDMKGTILHQWDCDITKQTRDPKKKEPPQEKPYIERLRLLPGGDLLANLGENHGLIKVDKESNLIWRYKGLVHHDLWPTKDGRIYVLAHS